MAVCDFCNKDMLEVDSCIEGIIRDKSTGEEHKPIPYGQEERFGEDYIRNEDHRCHDCNVKVGGYHHPGCDMEECPICHGQIISCDCDIE